MVVSCLTWMLGIEFWSSERAGSVLSHWVISLAPSSSYSENIFHSRKYCQNIILKCVNPREKTKEVLCVTTLICIGFIVTLLIMWSRQQLTECTTVIPPAHNGAGNLLLLLMLALLCSFSQTLLISVVMNALMNILCCWSCKSLAVKHRYNSWC